VLVVIRCARSQCKLQPSPWPTLVTRCTAIFRKCTTAPRETGDEKTARRKSERDGGREEREREREKRADRDGCCREYERGTKRLPRVDAPRAAPAARSRSIFTVNPSIDDLCQATERIQPASTVDRSRTNSWT